MRLLVAAYACNEREGLSTGVLWKIPRHIEGVTVDCLMVDDGSHDGSDEEAANQGTEVLRIPRTCGKASAIKMAFTYCLAHGYDLIINIDCDGQHDPNDISKFVRLLTAGIDVVLGVRFHPESPRQDVPIDRELLNVVVAAGLKHLTGRSFYDVLCGYRGFSRKAVKALLPKLEFSGYGAELEITFLLSVVFPELRVEEVPVAAVYSGTKELDRLYQPDCLAERLEERVLIHLRQLVELATRVTSY